MAALEVLALNTTVPQVQAPQTGDTYTFPRDIEIPLGTANSVLYLNASKTVTSGSALQIDSSGNVGVGVTPSAWGIPGNVELAGGKVLSFAGNGYVTRNAYYNVAWKYTTTNAASMYGQELGDHKWYTAPSGTAGDTISFTQAMTLDASGNLGVGTTSPDTRLDVVVSAGLAAIFGSESASNSYVGFKYNGTTLGYVGNGAGVAVGSAATEFSVGSTGARALTFGTNDTERARIDSSGNVVINTAAISTSATDGFLYVPTCAGTPTGTPTSYAGRSPIVIDSTNNRLYFYSGGAWRNAGP